MRWEAKLKIKELLSLKEYTFILRLMEPHSMETSLPLSQNSMETSLPVLDLLSYLILIDSYRGKSCLFKSRFFFGKALSLRA